MKIELINIGTELLLGSIPNTHQQWLGAELAGLGVPVSRQVTIPDNGPAIEAAVREALQYADLIITTGGLGPTSDDITRELVSELLRVPLELNGEVLAHLEKFFAARNRALPKSAIKQAMVPRNATVLMNANGTAPGLALSIPSEAAEHPRSKWIIMLPGPPRELHPMFRDQVIPIIQKEFGKPAYLCRIFKTTGLGEIFVEDRIAPHLEKLLKAGLEIGYCAKVGQVDIRLSTRMEGAAHLMSEAESIVQEELGKFLFTGTDIGLENVIVGLLADRRETVAVAESCTGGLISNRITDVPGASAVFTAGLITYSNEAKQRLLGVGSETLKNYGAVSENTAREMAEGAREKNNTDYGIAVTGIAGPGGGTTDKPVGTVFIALATPEKTVVQKNFNPYDRETFKFITSQQALDLLRQHLANVAS